MTTVLVADADRRDRRRVAAALRVEGYEVETVTTLAQAMSRLRLRQADALVIDPEGHDSVEQIAQLRTRTDAPIVVATADDRDRSIVAALDAGADDYVAKPHSLDELQARLRAVLRRSARYADEPAITTPDFTIDPAGRRLWLDDGTEVRLTPTEWRLVDMLVRRSGHLVMHADLLAGVWGLEATDHLNYLRLYMGQIRHKVEPDPRHPRYFVTSPGLGVRFDPTGGRSGVVPIGLASSAEPDGAAGVRA